MRIAIFVVCDRNGATPVTLTRDEPVAHFVSGLRGAVEVAVDEFGFDDGEIELFGKFTVAVVVGRDCHNSAGTVAGQNIVGDVNGDFLLGGRIDGVGAGENAGFLFVLLAFDFGFLEGVLFVLRDGVAGVVGDEEIEAGVFGSDY